MKSQWQAVEEGPNHRRLQALRCAWVHRALPGLRPTCLLPPMQGPGGQRLGAPGCCTEDFGRRWHPAGTAVTALLCKPHSAGLAQAAGER